MEKETQKCFVESWTNDKVSCKMIEEKCIREFDMHLFKKDKLFKGKNIYMEITIESGTMILIRKESHETRIVQLWNYYITGNFHHSIPINNKMEAIAKILLSPVTLIVWISNNVAEVLLLSVLVLSIYPFIWADKGDATLTIGGGFFSFCSVAFVFFEKREKPSLLYQILGLIILVIGASAFYYLRGLHMEDIHTPFQLFITTHFGAMLGIIFGGILFSEKFDLFKPKNNV